MVGTELTNFFSSASHVLRGVVDSSIGMDVVGRSTAERPSRSTQLVRHSIACEEQEQYHPNGAVSRRYYSNVEVSEAAHGVCLHPELMIEK